MLVSQISPSRAKRGINGIGTLWKWIAGTPDHDDLITVQNKIYDLIQNNNNQYVINSKLFKEIKTLSENLQTVLSNLEFPFRKHRLRLLTYELLIDNHVAKCNNRYYVISNFKTEIINNYGTLSPENTCFTSLLNGEKSVCNKIREYNKKIDVIQEGAIFINGYNTVNDTHLNGSFLITFNSTTRINNISYSNLDHKIIEHVTAKQYNDFLVSEYLMSNDSELSFDNINILNPFIQIKQTQIPITLILIILTLIYVIFTLVFKFKKYLIFKPRQIHIEITPENNMSELSKCRIDKSSKFSLYDTSNESGRFNLEGAELSSS